MCTLSICYEENSIVGTNIFSNRQRKLSPHRPQRRPQITQVGMLKSLEVNLVGMPDLWDLWRLGTGTNSGLQW